MLEFRNISVEKKGKKILSNISFSIEKGKHTVLLGKNGSGKTTLLNCVNGTSDYCGEILLHGKNLKELSFRERGKKIGFMPQLLSAPHITVLELVSMGRTPHIGLGARPSAEDREMVEQAIYSARLGAIKDSYLDRISGGELQRAYLGLVLAQDAELIVLDEPTSHMDIAAGEEFLSLANRIVFEHGKTLLTVIHDISAAVSYCNNVAILESGELSFFGSREECLESGIINRVFNVRSFLSDGKYFFAL